MSDHGLAPAEGAVIEVVRARWDPGWYNLDQSLAVGQRDSFCFSRLTTPEPHGLLFHSSMLSGEEEWRDATVVSIRHPMLGDLTSVDTGTFGEYIFRLADGGSVSVEAEENPPHINRQSPDGVADEVRGWALEISLDNVSGPRSTRHA